MKSCLNAYYLDMWINVVKDMGADPRIAVDVKNASRKIIVPDGCTDSAGIAVFNLAHYAISDYTINKTTGYMFARILFDGARFRMEIPCESIMCVMSKEPAMCGQMLDDLLMIDADHGFFFELEKISVNTSETGSGVMPKASVVDIFSGKPVEGSNNESM